MFIALFSRRLGAVLPDDDVGQHNCLWSVVRHVRGQSSVVNCPWSVVFVLQTLIAWFQLIAREAQGNGQLTKDN